MRHREALATAGRHLAGNRPVAAGLHVPAVGLRRLQRRDRDFSLPRRLALAGAGGGARVIGHAADPFPFHGCTDLLLPRRWFAGVRRAAAPPAARLSRAGRSPKLEPARGLCRRRDQRQRKDLPPGKRRPAAPPARPSSGCRSHTPPDTGQPQPAAAARAERKSGSAGSTSLAASGQAAAQVDRRDAGREKRGAPAARLVPPPACGPTHPRSTAGATRQSAAGHSRRSEAGEKDQRPGRGPGGRRAPRPRPAQALAAGGSTVPPTAKATYLSPVAGLRGAQGGEPPALAPRRGKARRSRPGWILSCPGSSSGTARRGTNRPGIPGRPAGRPVLLRAKERRGGPPRGGARWGRPSRFRSAPGSASSARDRRPAGHPAWAILRCRREPRRKVRTAASWRLCKIRRKIRFRPG